MGLRGIGGFIKYSMFLFNAVILVAGCALVGFGIYTRTSSASVTKFSSVLGSNLLPTISLVLIITGAVIIFLSFLGCCGAIKEVKCMLLMFFFLLLLLFLAFLVGGILFYAFRDKIEDTALNQLRRQVLDSYGREGEESVTDAWDSMQKVFKCCGVSGNVNSSDSWAIYKLSSRWFQMQTELTPRPKKFEYVPVSCCVDTENTPNVTKCQGSIDQTSIPMKGPPVLDFSQLNDQLHTEGCYTSLRNMLASNVNILIGVGAGIAVAMVLGMVFSICLCRKIRNEDDYDECD